MVGDDEGSLTLWLYVPRESKRVLPNRAAADEFMRGWFGQDFDTVRSDEAEGVRYWCRVGDRLINTATLTRRDQRCAPALDRAAPDRRVRSWWERLVGWFT